METDPGNSSSESDTSDSWSIIYSDSREAEGVPAYSTVKDRDNISGEPSDGESLEVIDEEKQGDEYKDAGMETDGISIITESDRSDELDEPFSLVVFKEKRYLHHPNTYLNTRLSLLLAVSFAAVIGLGLGHFLGSQEECPLLNESATMLLKKLQRDNRLLHYKIEKLLSEKHAASHSLKDIEAWECGIGINLTNEGLLHLPPSFQAGVLKQILNSEMTNLQVNMIGCQQHTSEYRNEDEDEAKNVAKNYSTGSMRRFPSGESSEYVTPVQNKDESVVKEPSGMKAESVPFDSSSEYVTLVENEAALGAMNVPDIEISENSVMDSTDNVEDLKFVQFRDYDGVAMTPVELNDARNIPDCSVLIPEHEAVANFPSVIKNEENYVESSVEDDGVVVDDDEVFAFLVSLDRAVSTHLPEGDGMTEVSRNLNNLEPEMIQETYDWEKNNIKIIKSTLKLLKIIKSTLKLLQTPTDDYKVSPYINNIFSFSVALATELEQSLVHLQNAITHCESEKSDFCAQIQKRMDVSVSEMKETAEGLVDNIVEQLYKLLIRIVRKLKKCKGNLQDKWCHLTGRYDCENDAICNWLHSSVLLDCKESNRKTKRKLKHFSSKGLDELDENILINRLKKQTGVRKKNILKSNIEEEEYDGFKSVNLDTASDSDQKNSNQYADGLIPLSIIPDDIFIKYHDSLNEQHLEINVPVTVSKAFEKSSGKYQYIPKLDVYWKHDNQGPFKSHFSGEEKDKYENKLNNVPETRACQQTNGKTVCQKFKNNQQFLHSQKSKNKYVKYDNADNQSYEKRNWKNHISDKDKKEYKRQQTKHSLHDKSKYRKHPVSGDWMLKMANARAEQRRLEHTSDWLFDRAAARKMERERHRVTSNWYFQRARGREYCRYHPDSDWCKTGINNGQIITGFIRVNMKMNIARTTFY